MVLKTDQERIKTLITDTITLLCKNGLSFQSEFSIEALIGITLDKNDVFLVSIKEDVGTEKTSQGHERQESSASSSEDRRGSKKRRFKSEKSDLGHDTDEGSDDSYSPMNTSSFEVTESVPSKAKRKRQHSEQGNLTAKQEDDDDDDDNAVTFIKQEVGDTWQTTVQAEGTELSMHDFATFPGSNMSSQVNTEGLGQSQWSQTSRSVRHGSSTGFPSAAASTSAMSTGRLGDGGQDDPGSQDYTEGNLQYCKFCNKAFNSRDTLVTHERLHRREYRHYCSICGKGFMGTNHLAGHMSSHTGIKQFKCSFCLKEYAYKSHLKEHLELKHNDQYVSRKLFISSNLTALINEAKLGH